MVENRTNKTNWIEKGITTRKLEEKKPSSEIFTYDSIEISIRFDMNFQVDPNDTQDVNIQGWGTPN